MANASILSSFRDFFGEIAMVLEFNHRLIARGWIAHPWINSPLAKQAVKAARRGDWQAADDALVEAYSPAAVRFWLTTHLRKLRSFKPRLQLALLALEDYESERFHACVPVTLALLDGMGKDELGQNILRHGVQLAVVGTSFLEVGPGLTELLRLFCRGRNKTSNAPIDIPYRHGILHGVELGYANATVAAKAWGALIAFGSYAQDRSDATSDSEEPATTPSLPDVLLGALDSRRYSAFLEERASAWHARKNDEVLTSIAKGTLPLDAPEETVRRIMEAWSEKKPGVIARFLVNWKHDDPNFFAGAIRRNLRLTGKSDAVPPPDAYEILSTQDVTISHTVVELKISWRDLADATVELRLTYYVNDKPHPRVAPNGKWLVVQAWPLESAVLSYLTSQAPEE